MDGEGRVLLLNPTYKSGWDIPGGVVERNESPLAACCRELREELGLDVVALRLLGVDYRTAVQRVRGDALRFVFVGPQLTSDDIAGIRLDPAEHSEFGLVAVNALDEYLLPVAVRRLRALLAAESALYLEEGEAPSP
jgi:8-oxo-dGTP pyrophosphatase MutT (NUDIX family)